MSTRSYIGKLNPDGSVLAAYCHYDGYLEGVGKILKEHYTSEEKLDQLLELGQLSSLGAEIGEKHDFDNRDSKFCTFYGRDRGESGTESSHFSDLDKYTHSEGVSYHYLFDSGKWRVFHHRLETKMA